jgi:YVTN family beta-propeller protein
VRLILGFVIVLVSLAGDVFGQSVLNFPRVISSQQTFTGIAVSNPSSLQASVTFAAFQADGTAFQNPRTVTIPAGGQYARQFSEIFPITGTFNGWLQATSATPGLTGFFLNANLSITDVDGAGAGVPSAEFILPITSEDEQARTELTLLNTNTGSAAATAVLYATDGTVIATKPLTLNGRSLVRQTMQPMFGAADLAAASHVRVQSDIPIVGHAVVADFRIPDVALRRETIAVAGQQAAAATAYVLPQFVTGRGWTSYLSVVNGNGVAQEITLTAYKEDGTQWEVPANPKQISLAGNASLKTTVGEFFEFPQAQFSAGWIEVRSSLGFVISNIGFGNVDAPSFAMVSAVDAGRATRLNVYSHIAEGGGFFTGLTVVNPNREPATVEFFALRPDGTTIGRSTFTVGPNQRIGKLFRELLPSTFEQLGGWAFLRSSQPVVAAALFGSTNGLALANVPAQAPSADFVPPAQSTAAITGTVHQDVQGAAGVTVTLTGPVTTTKTTDSSGLFAFTQLPPGEYKVSVSKTSAQFFPSERGVTLARENVDNIDFDAVGIAPADAPVVAFLTPASIFGGTSAFNITVLGSNFNQASVVVINDQQLQTTFVKSTELRAAVPGGFLRSPGVLSVSVLTPPPGGGSSNKADLTINVLPTNPLIEGRAAVGPFPAGVAIHPVRKWALVTSESADSVTIIDLKHSLRNMGEVKVGRSPAEGIAIYAERDIALVANVGDDNVSIIDLRTNTVTQTIKVERFPTGVAVNPVTNRAVVVNGESDSVSLIDLNSMTVVGTIKVGRGPSSVAINTRTNIAVVTNRRSNDVSIIDLTAGAIVGNNISVGSYPRGVAINPDRNTAVVANANSNTISILNLATRAVIGTVEVGTGPTGVAIHPPTNTAVITNSGATNGNTAFGAANTVSIVNLDQREVIAVPVGAGAFGVDIDVEMQQAVIANFASNDIFVVRLPNPKPRVTDIEPKTFPAGGGAFTITVRGTGFLETSVVTLNGQPLPTTFVSSTELRAEVTAALVQQMLQRRGLELADTPKKGGVFEAVTEVTFDVGVSNPGPGGGDSVPPADGSANRMQVLNAAPVMISVEPTQIAVGASEARLFVSGNNLNATTRLNFGPNAYSPATVSATSMTVIIPAEELRTPRPVSVTVTNPPPGGGTTTPLTFTVLDNPNPAPSISGVTPTEIPAGSSTTTVRITGSGFIAATLVTLEGVAQRLPATITGTSIEFTVSDNLLQSPGTIAVLVTNPAPGGGSAGFNINVLNPAPVVSSFSPQATPAGGSSVELRVLGSRFGANSVVTIEGTPVPTQLVSPQELRATLSAAFLVRGGRLRVAVKNSPPGGGSADAGELAITTSKPALSGINPPKGPVGARSFAVQLTGSGFVANSAVAANGIALTTTFNSSAALTVTIPDALMARPGLLRITVTNPEPGGGTSEPINFSIEAGVPRLDSIDPVGVRTDQAGSIITLNGSNFVEGATVVLGLRELPAAFVSSSQLRLTLPALMVLGKATIAVKNPLPGGGISNAIDFTVTALVPSIAEIRPSSTASGQTITIAGNNFGIGSLVTIGGMLAASTTVSETQITAVVPFEVPAGTAGVIVVNPEPGGGTSNEMAIQLSAAIPVITALNPATLLPAQPSTTITITGRGFANRAVVHIDGVAVSTTFVNETTLRFVMPAVTGAGVTNITVVNPPPGGGVSTAFALTIQNPVPALTFISPTSAPSGTTATLTATGTGFVEGSTIHFAGQPLPTTFVSGTTLTAPVTLTVSGPQQVTIINPAPGGGISNSVDFQGTVALNPVPTISSLSPAFVGAGATTGVGIRGSGFVPGSTVSLDGSSLGPATFQSSDLILATLPGLSAGTHTLVVTNPLPGGGPSNGFVITAITSPTITSVAPGIAAAGSGSFTMTIGGANFGASASAVTVAFGTTVLNPVTVAPGQLTVVVPASLLSTETTLILTVRVNGISTNAVSFPVRYAETFATGLNGPRDVAVNSQNEVFISNSGTGSILKISPLGAVSTFATGFNTGAPAGLAVSSTGEVFVADNLHGTISKIASNGTITPFVSGLNKPNDILFDAAGNLLVADSGDGTIKKVTPAGAVSTYATLSGLAPFGLAMTGDGALYVSDYSTGQILKITGGGETHTTLAFMNKLSDGLAIDASGRLFVGNGAAGTLDRIDLDGRVAHLSTGMVASGPIALALDTTGVVFAAFSNQIVRYASRASTAPEGAPFVSRMEPAIGAPAAVLYANVLGSGLANASALTFSPNKVATIIEPGGTSAQLPVTLTVSSAATAEALTFTVATPLGTTNPSRFDIVSTPSITSISPSTTTAESDAFVLTVNGSNFHDDALLRFGSEILAPLTRTASQLTVHVPTSAVLNIETLNVAVKTAAAVSNTVPFVVRTPVTNVVIAPVAPVLTSFGAKHQFNATARNVDGEPVAGKVFSWASSNTSVASIDATGLVTAAGNGEVTITSTVDGVSATALLKVEQAVATISVSPASATLTSLEATQPFSAELKDANGNIVANQTVTWSSTAPAVATVDPASGIALAVSDGTTSVKATAGDKSASASLIVAQAVASIEVSPATVTLESLNVTQIFTALAKDAKGKTIPGKSFTWSSDESAVVSINATGTATALGDSGSTPVTIRARVDDKEGTATILVSQKVVTVTVTASSTTITSLNATQQFTATIKDGNNQSMAGKPVDWSSDKPEIASVDSNGLVKAIANGSAIIKAKANGASGELTVLVDQAVHSISVAPAEATLNSIGDIQEFTATLKDAGGTAVTGKTIEWSSNNTEVAEVDASTGSATAKANGVAEIKATVGSKTATATLTVAQAVSTIQISPESKTFDSLDETATFTVTAKDAKGNAITGATWTSSHPEFASVDGTSGVVEAKANGSATITVTVGGKSATAQVVVSQVVSSVEVVVDGPSFGGTAPSTPGLVSAKVFVYAAASTVQFPSLGDVVQFKVNVKDQLGNTISGKTISWNSDKPDLIEIDSTGKATARRNGSANLTATVEGKSGSIPVVVQQVVASVVVEPATKTFVSFGETHTFKATPRDARENPISGKTIAWTATAPVTIDGAGVATAGTAEGNATVTATVDGQSMSVPANIAQEVATITVSPDTNVVKILGVLPAGFTAVAKDSRDHVVNRPVEWLSSDASVASMDSLGRPTAHRNGRVSISARIGGKTGIATLIVAQGSARIHLLKGFHRFNALKRVEKILAKFVDANDNEVGGKTFIWSSDNPSVATVDPLTGDITAVGNGTATITVSADGVSSSVTIVVSQLLHRVVITDGGSVRLKAFGHKRKFIALALDEDGHPIVGKKVSWKSDDDSIASVDEEGEATARFKNGRVRLRAFIEDKFAEAELDVDQEIDSIISLTGLGKLKALQRARQYKAVDANGHAIVGKIISWLSSADGIASIDAAGIAKAKGNGLAKIRAILDGKTVETDLEVSQEVTSVHLGLDPGELPGKLRALKKKRQFRARAKDPDGFDIVDKIITWKTSDNATASIDGNGLATAERNGRAFIRAMIDGIESAPLDLEIEQATKTVHISGDSDKITSLKRKRKFTAKARDENGFEIEGKTAAWFSTNGIVPVDALGEITANGNGVSILRALIDGIEGTMSVTVDQEVHRLHALETGKLKAKNRTRSFTAVDEDGHPIAGKTITWGSSDPDTVSVIGGIATARKNGTARARATVSGKTVETDVIVEQEVKTVELASDGPHKLSSFNLKRKLIAIAKDLDGYPVDGRSVSWASSNSVALPVDALGEVTAKKNGLGSLSATIDGVKSNSLSLEVSQVVAKVEPAPGEKTGKFRAKNETRQFVAKDALGSLIEKVVAWRVTGDASVAEVNTTGRVSARQNRKASAVAVAATVDGTTVWSDVDVEQVAVRVVIEPPTKRLRWNKDLPLQATAYDENDNPVEDKVIQWTVDKPFVASFSANKLTGRILGANVRVTASVDGASDTLDLEVER